MFHWYGVFIGIAIVVGWSVAEGIDPKVNKIAPWVLLFGLLGARIYHVIDFWDYYSLHLNQIVMVWKGGLSIWGGLMGGLLAWWIVGRRSWEMLGAVVTGLPLAQAIGRLGNAINGEFINRVWILPWWAAEAIFDLMLFALLWGRTPKYRIWIYLLGYGLIRLVLQPYR